MWHECYSLEFFQGDMCLVYRTRPDATIEDWNPKTLNIKGPMMGHSTGSDNYIWKKKLQGKLIYAQPRKALDLMHSRVR